MLVAIIRSRSTVSHSKMENLSDLPLDVLVVISKQLKKLEDFVSFSCVSKSLHAAAKDECFEGVRCRQHIPYLLLPVREDDNDDVRELYSLVEGESIVASVKVPNLKTKKCYESLGWLLGVVEDGSMSLFEPVSGSEFILPHQHDADCPESVDAHVFIEKMVLSARPNETLDFVVMVILGARAQLRFWRVGDRKWNILEQDGGYTDVIHIGGGKFYAIGYGGVVWAFNLAGGNNNQVEAHPILDCGLIISQIWAPSRNVYLLKTIDGNLLIITRISPFLADDYMTSKFQVYEVDIDASAWKEIHSLGKMAVFVGHNSTIALDASELSRGVNIKANHIYFTEDDLIHYFFDIPKGGGKNMGAYNLETGSVEQFYPGEPLRSKVSTPVWITPCI